MNKGSLDMSLTGTSLPIEKLRSSPWKAPESSLPSLGRDIARAFLQNLPALQQPAPAWLRSQLTELSREGDEEFLMQGLVQVGVRLKNENQDEAAHQLLARLSQEDVPSAVRTKAAAEDGAMLGTGSGGLRAEFLLSRFAKNSTDARLIVPMIGGTIVGQAFGAAVFGRLAGSAARGSASWLSRGLGARLAAGSAGFFGEVAGFAGLSRALAPQAHGDFSDDLLRAALTMGTLRLAGAASNRATFLAPERVMSAAPAQILKQGTTFLGLGAAHRLEERLGLRPHVEGETFFLDTLSSLAALSVGGHLGRGVLGNGLAQFQAELGLRGRPNVEGRSGLNFLPGLRPAGGPAALFHEGGGKPEFPNILMMSAQGPGGRRFTGFGPPHQPPALPAANSSAAQAANGSPSPPPASGPAAVGTHEPVIIDAQDPYIGTTFLDRYKVDSLLGFGGIGMVYRGTHAVIDKKVAIKLLKPEYGDPTKAENKEGIERFLREAKITSKVNNQHVIDITDYGQLPNGAAFFVMEYLEGSDLASLLEKRQRLFAREIAHIGIQAADGLFAAHQAGIVHRDLKPANIFLIKRGLDANFVKILDFGIAKFSYEENKSKLTQAGAVFGTPAYISPEQAAGKVVDHRADIYSFGTMLYEMATGQLPFDGPNFMAIMTKHMYNEPVKPRTLVPDLPEGLEAIILRCMRKKPDHRYQTMWELKEDLEKLAMGLAPEAITVLKALPPPKEVAAELAQETGNDLTTVKRLTPEQIFFARNHKPILVGAGVAAAALVGLAILFVNAPGPVPLPAPPPLNPVPTEPVDGAKVPPQPSSEKIEAPSRDVQVTLDPPDAHIFLDGQDMGNSPTKFTITEGTKLEIEVRRQGYFSQTVVLDAANPAPVIQLKRDFKQPLRPLPKNSGVKPPVPVPQPRPSGTGGVINPFK